ECTVFTASDVVGLFLAALGVALALWFKRRRFNRTNAYGVQSFPSFTAKVRAQTADRLMRAASIGCTALAVLMLAVGHVETWGWIIVTPLAGYALFVLLGS
ncbi:MAG: hypothetical protein ABIP49_00925, partial [Lysobacterales bacterium]